MSDIAVTWAKAQTCWLRPGVKDRSAGQTLVHLASYADAEGEAYALVGLLAMEMDTSERTVQRGLAALKSAGLIAPTGEFKKHNGRLVPYYQLALDQGPANTRERLRIERAKAAPGDTGVTPREGAGCHGRHPSGDMGVRPRGDTGVTQIGKEITQELTLKTRARAIDAATKAWAAKAPERVSLVKVERSWAAAIERSGRTDDQLLAAVLAAVAKDPDFGRNRAVALDRWLDEGRFEGWLLAGADAGGEGSANGGGVVWAGPDDVRRAVADLIGPGPLASYLDPSGWDEERRMITTRTRFAADALKQSAGRALKALGVSVEFERGDSARSLPRSVGGVAR